MIVITFAMQEESKDFLPLLSQSKSRAERPDMPIVEGLLNGVPVTVVHIGVGPQSAAIRLAASGALQGSVRPKLLICPGYGGGLAPQLRHADLLLVDNFSDASLLAHAAELLGSDGVHRGPLKSEMVVIDSAADKAALHAKTGAVAVDMETAAVAEACAAAGVPMLALRVISDDASATLPVPGYLLWDLETQKPPIPKLLWHLITHPGRIGPFVRMMKSLAPARARLTDTLVKLVGRFGVE